MLDILGVLVDSKTLPSFDREPRVDPQHRRGFGSGLLKLSRLRAGGRQEKMGPLQIGQARRAFAQQTHRLPIALEQVIGQTHLTKGAEERLKRIEADVCLQYLDRSCGLAPIRQGFGESIIEQVGIERGGSLEVSHGGVVLALVNQDMSKLSVSLRQAGVEVYSRLRQFKGAIERSGTEIIAIE